MINEIGGQKTTADFVQQFASVSGSLGRVGNRTKALAASLNPDSLPAGRALVAALEELGAEWSVLVEYLPMMFEGDRQ